MAQSWTVPPSSRSAVSRAGERLAALPDLRDASDDDLDLVNCWRSAHSFPLNTVQSGLRRQSNKLSKHSLVTQRLKRLTSVVSKLQRNENKMQLARMQDIGGCRAVVKTIRQAYRLHDLVSEISHASRSRYALRGQLTDYIKNPQRSGYRSLHQVVRFQAHETARSSVWNNLDIEIQIRTRLQHAWATAVETVDVLKGTDLKAGGGSSDWRLFFALAASAIAIHERQPPVPGTSSSIDEIRQELKELNSRLRALPMLRRFALTAQQVVGSMGEEFASRKSYLLIELDAETSRYSVKQFRLIDAEAANQAYAELEAKVAHEPMKEAVLVVTDSLRALQKAYPSYAGNPSTFVTFMEGVLWRSS